MTDGKRYLAHSKKHLQKVRDMFRAVDIVLEMVDARAPSSTQNEALSRVDMPAARVLILHKSDLAESDVTRAWMEYFRKARVNVFSFSAGLSRQKLLSFLQEYRASGNTPRFNRPLRLMVAGMPNVGKSTLVNMLLRKKVVRTGDRPGITRGSQWIRIHPRLELLDTPGVLQPAAEEEWTFQCLAALGILPANRIDPEEAAVWLLRLIEQRGRLTSLDSRYGKEFERGAEPEQWMETIGRSRGCLRPGGKVDLTEVSRVVLRDFQEGSLGALSLEEPPETE